MQNPTRREFLGSSGAALGAAAIDLGAFAGGRDEIRVGLIGCGGRGTGAVEDISKADPGVRLVAMADLFEERIKLSLDVLRTSIPQQVSVDADHCFVGFDAYKKVLECADVVLIACTSKFHPRLAKAALEAGKHVFVEKPHAIDMAGIRELEAACRIAKEKKLSLASGLQSRHHSKIGEAMKRVHDGAIGEIVAAQECFMRTPYRLMARKPGQKEIEYQFYNWYHFNWLSGDDVTQSLVHNLDRATWALKEQTPVRAHGLGGRSASFGEVYGDVFDHHSVVYEYANGARVFAFCRTQMKCHGQSGSLLLGTKGRCDLVHGIIQGENPWTFEGNKINPYVTEQRKLVEGIRSGRPVNNGDYMVRSTQVAIMGQVACYTGQLVTWDEISRSSFAFAPTEATFDSEPPIVPGPDGNYPLPVPGTTKLI